MIALVLSLSLWSSSLPGQNPDDIDNRQLKALDLPNDTAGLIEFIRLKMPRQADALVLQTLISQLRGENVKEREAAIQELLQIGWTALPALKAEQMNKANWQVENCIKKIETPQRHEPVVMAARILAQRRATAATPVLFDFVVHLQNTWIEDEFIGNLARLTDATENPDPLFLEAIHSTIPARRAVAAYLLGRHGGMEVRAALRKLLDDPDPLVRERSQQGLAGKRTLQAILDLRVSDEDTLRAHQLDPTDQVLLSFLKQRTRSMQQLADMKKHVRDLGHASFIVRERASRLLVTDGTPALPLLKTVLSDLDVEVVRRAQSCIEQIQTGPGPNLTIAVIHALVASTESKSNLEERIQTILAYVPFAEDPSIEEEALIALTLLNLRQVSVHPSLEQALTDPMPARRGAAAYVLGHVGLPEHEPLLQKLLTEPLPEHRLRVVQGILATHNRSAIPHLIDLLESLPIESLGRAESLLYRLAGEKTPTDLVAIVSAKDRQQAVKTWKRWWKSQGDQLDLTRLVDLDTYLGLVTVCEYDSANGQPGGQIWEALRDGLPRWKLIGVEGAMDAHVLPNGRILVAENSSNRVTERALNNRIVWQHKVPGDPIYCQRLPNGNTFIALYNQVLEVTPQGKEVYHYTPGPQFYIFGAHKAKNGNIVAITAQGIIVELDSATGRQIRSINLGPNGNWCGIESLPNGNYLVALQNSSQVREVTPENKIVWSANFTGVFRATRLPNGNTLVASMNTHRVAELDREGRILWERTCVGRPWSIHYR